MTSSIVLTPERELEIAIECTSSTYATFANSTSAVPIYLFNAKLPYTNTQMIDFAIFCVSAGLCIVRSPRVLGCLCRHRLEAV